VSVRLATVEVMSDPVQLKAAVSGPVLVPGDEGFDAELAGFNTAYPQRPDIVVGAASPGDVLAAIAYARDAGLHVSSFATGHGTHAPSAGGMIISLGRLSSVSVDPETRLATIGGGARWSTVVEAAAPHGLAPIAGSSTGVGVAGYLLGGGLGPFSRSHGFSSDWVRRITIATAAGQLVTASVDENPELFWALRGGKGGFGVVVEYVVELAPAHSIYGGALVFAEEHIERALRGWIDYTRTAPTDVTTSVAIIQFPGFEEVPAPLRGRRLLMLRFGRIGDVAAGEQLAAPLRALAPVYLDGVRPLAITELALIHSDPTQPGPGWGRGGLLSHADQDFATLLLALAGSGSSAPFIGAELRHLGGATHVDVPEGSSVGGRAAQFAFHLLGVPDVSLFEAVLPAAASAFVESIAPWVAAESTINFADDHDREQFRAAWSPAAFERLAAVRSAIDPGSVFAYGPREA